MPVRLLMGTVVHPSGMKPEELLLLQQSLFDFAVDSVPGSGQYIGEERPEAVIAAILRLAGAASVAVVADQGSERPQ